MDTQKIGDKIRKLRKSLGISQKEFASMIDVSYGALQSYEYGEVEPRRVIINTICMVFNKPLSYFYDNEVANNSYIATSSDQIYLNFYSDVRASAGYGAFNDDENITKIAVSSAFLTQILGVLPKEYDIIKACGDSMEPFIKDGDMVLVDKGASIRNGDIVIAILEDSLYVKKYLIDPIKKLIKLTSLNSFYQDITLDETQISQLNIIGKVVARFNVDARVFRGD